MINERFEKTRYFAIFRNRSIAEYRNFESTDEFDDNIWLLIKDKCKCLFQPAEGYKWRVSSYVFYKPNKEEFKYNFNNWHLEDIEITYISSSVINYDLIISDPKRRIRRIKDIFKQGRRYGHLDEKDIGLIIQSIDHFNSIATYSSWEEFDLKVQIEILQRENEKLRTEINKQKDEIDQYRLRLQD